MSDSHEAAVTSATVRELRWRIKQLGKQSGRQGETIYRLRAELAEVRDMNSKVARGEARKLARSVKSLLDSNARLTRQVCELREKLSASEVSVESEGGWVV